MTRHRLRALLPVVALLAAQVALAPPSLAAPAGALTLSDTVVAPATKVTLKGRLPPARSRTVRLQERNGTTWHTLVTKDSTRRGAFTFTITSPGVAGDQDYRVVAPPATLGGQRYDAVVTPTRTLTVVTMGSPTAGWKHSCALGSDRRAWCWGSNTYGELGDGTGGTSTGTLTSGPVQVVGGDWTDIDATMATTCGVKSDGTGWCWGDGATYFFPSGGWVPAPRQVSGTWSQISAGASYYCGVRPNTTGWCQGQNDDGQLGTTAATTTTVPSRVPGSWVQIVAGGTGSSNTTCGIKVVDRSAWCWGTGERGQLGNGQATSSPTPVKVSGGRQWASLSVGGRHVCGLTTDGAGWCWGENTDGRLGDGSNNNQQDVPVRVKAATSWAVLDAGEMHTCGVAVDGSGWCFGWNRYAQLGNGKSGDGATQYFPVPDPTRLPGTWTDVAAGFHHNVGVQAPGLLWAWGEGSSRQTGQAAEPVTVVPTRVVVDP